MKRRICGLTLWGVLGLLLMSAVVAAQAVEKGKRPAKVPSDHVMLTVDYGDGGQKRYPAVPWKSSMTVMNVMEWAAKHPHGIRLVQRGRGETALVTQIDDLKNGSGDDRNWIYRVNGKLADRSCAVFPVRRGDAVLWRFETYQ